MTPVLPGSRPRILLLTDSLGGFSAPAGTALNRLLSSKSVDADVTATDFFDEFLPDLSVLAKLAYTQDAAFMPSVSGSLEAASAALPDNPVVLALAGGGAERVSSFVSAGAFDVVVTTSPVAAATLCELSRAHRPAVVSVVAAFSLKGTWIHPGCDLYFVATKEVREDLVMAGVAYSRIVVSGIPSAVPEDSATRNALRGRAGVADRFTAVLGGAGQSAVDVRFVAGALAEHGIQVIVVPGRESRIVRQLRALATSNRLVRVIESSASVRAAMLGDVVLGRAGGSVLLEAVCAGVPSVIYNPVASQETANVDFLLNVGASLLSRDDDDVVEKVRFLAGHTDRVAQMSACAATVGSNKAVKTIADRLAAFIRKEQAWTSGA